MAEVRLIDANALPRHGATMEGSGEHVIVVLNSDIALAPTVGLEPVRHGQWMWKGRFKACSLCGSYIDLDGTLGAKHWKFCPYCGAKMDKPGQTLAWADANTAAYADNPTV